MNFLGTDREGRKEGRTEMGGRLVSAILLTALASSACTVFLYERSLYAGGNSVDAVPFHHAFPVHDLVLAKRFYGGILGLQEGRSSERWIDYSLSGNQIVCHLVENHSVHEYHNVVDADDVPVPHFGLAMSVDQFHTLSTRLKQHNISFIIEPHLRFQGLPGEQWTMFFKDLSSNNLEFKAMVHPENLFIKYHHVEEKSTEL